MAEAVRILVPGAGGPGTLNLCRSLKRAPEPLVLIGTDCDRYFSTLSLTDEVRLVPPAREETAYIAAIKKIVKEESIDLIMPNNSLEIRALATHRFSLGAELFAPTLRTLDLANSKWASYKVWAERGIPVPKTELLEHPAQVEPLFRSFGKVPIWVRGAGIPGKGIGVASLPCRTHEQALQWINFWKGWGGMIASEFLPGANLTWIGIFKNGQRITGQCRQRDRYIIPHVSPSGITGAPALSHTVHRDDVDEIAMQAALSLDSSLDGVVFVDLKEDAQGQPRVTEMNAGRFGTTHFFYTAAGLNLPWIAACLALGKNYGPVDERHPLPANLYWIRTLDAGPVLIKESDLNEGRFDRGLRFGLHGEQVDTPPNLVNSQGD